MTKIAVFATLIIVAVPPSPNTQQTPSRQLGPCATGQIPDVQTWPKKGHPGYGAPINECYQTLNAECHSMTPSVGSSFNVWNDGSGNRSVYLRNNSASKVRCTVCEKEVLGRDGKHLHCGEDGVLPGTVSTAFWNHGEFEYRCSLASDDWVKCPGDW
jgi:hypothetical protein